VAKGRVIPQMFDVRPVDKTGNLDWGKINRVKKSIQTRDFNFSEKLENSNHAHSDLPTKQSIRITTISRGLEFRLAAEPVVAENKKENSIWLKKKKNLLTEKNQYLRKIKFETAKQKKEENKQLVLAKKISLKERKKELREAEKNEKLQIKAEIKLHKECLILERKNLRLEEKLEKENQKRQKNIQKKTQPGYFYWKDLFVSVDYFSYNTKQSSLAFVMATLFLAIGIGGASFVYKGLNVKGSVLGVSQDGYESLTAAINDISSQNFDSSSENFTQAFEYFSQASDEMDQMGTLLNEGSRFFPYISKLSSGKNILEAGSHLSLAGKHMNGVVKEISIVKNPLEGKENISFLELFKKVQKDMNFADQELRLAFENIEKVKINDLPEDMQDKFLILREQLPRAINLSGNFLQNSDILLDLLGNNGSRKYLFLFQNNNEMRPTGGFIGSYGLLDISQGNIRNFFIDGIFNPDGQLKEKIIPPKPIQKISAAWSLHDSNWFPDFPTSAKEAILFYEKTGGPTVDGVITFTPVILQKLLEITGPIEMPEYGVILDSNNFVEKTQYEVEEDYDRQENKPKKILSDLAPLILDQIVNSKNPETFFRSIKVFLGGLEEKHILIYSENKELQKIISENTWSGEILKSKKDYLSVINTNINGYKTDGVIEEKIEHKAEIAEDGSIVDTVSITRKHNGGNTQYEWWNKVNANYMRVYVPEGSRLLEVNGQTWEINEPVLDYDKLGFKKNKLIQQEEDGMEIDPNTGTRIYQENGKTVFANWTYVSPQETMTITYKYILPFKIFPAIFNSDKQVDSYFLVAQKQSGSVGSDFATEIHFPSTYSVRWKSSENIQANLNVLKLTDKLNIDRFMGVVFEKNK